MLLTIFFQILNLQIRQKLFSVIFMSSDKILMSSIYILTQSSFNVKRELVSLGIAYYSRSKLNKKSYNMTACWLTVQQSSLMSSVQLYKRCQNRACLRTQIFALRIFYVIFWNNFMAKILKIFVIFCITVAVNAFNAWN